MYFCIEELKMNRLLLAALFCSLANSSPVGAPRFACDTLEPQHGVEGQTTPSPYAFVAVNNGDGTYQGTIMKLYTPWPNNVALFDKAILSFHDCSKRRVYA